MLLDEGHIWVKLVSLENGLCSQRFVFSTVRGDTEMQVHPEFSVFRVEHDCPLSVLKLFRRNRAVGDTNLLTFKRNFGCVKKQTSRKWAKVVW